MWHALFQVNLRGVPENVAHYFKSLMLVFKISDPPYCCHCILNRDKFFIAFGSCLFNRQSGGVRGGEKGRKKNSFIFL